MGHIRLTGNRIEHDTSNVMLSKTNKEKDKIINDLKSISEKLNEIAIITKGVSDTTNEINDYLDKNYKKYDELYDGGSPLVKEFIHTVKVTYITGPEQSSINTEETGENYRDEATNFVNLVKDDSRLISLTVNECPVEHMIDTVDEYTQIITDTYKIEVIVEYTS